MEQNSWRIPSISSSASSPISSGAERTQAQAREAHRQSRLDHLENPLNGGPLITGKDIGYQGMLAADGVLIAAELRTCRQTGFTSCWPPRPGSGVPR